MLKNFDPDYFLKHIWQKKPLLIKQAVPKFRSPLSPDEIAGLACEEDIESRILLEKDNDWQVQLGPFSEQRFSELPERNWTLLVQAVDHYIAELSELRQAFNFIPNWRIDDIMVSYAVTGGSVGPHYDNYDVFLLQGAGKREWQLGQFCDQNTTLATNPSVRLLADFQAQQRWVLEAGDMLYLPPRHAHWGTGLDDDCITYSIGFRAPSYGEILAQCCDERLSQLHDHLRYNDPDLQLQANPGEISEQAIDQVRDILLAQLTDRHFIASCFGRYMTEPKYPQHHDVLNEFQPAQLVTRLNSGSEVLRDPAARFAYIKSASDTERAILFINGEQFPCSLALAMLLSANIRCACQAIVNELNDPDNVQLIVQLFNQGSLYFDEEYYD
jgi:50S ribosomal protein L16 3-hydroxylase